MPIISNCELKNVHCLVVEMEKNAIIYAQFLERWDICPVTIDLLQLMIQ